MESVFSMMAAAAPNSLQGIILALPFFLTCIMLSGAIIFKPNCIECLDFLYTCSPMYHTLESLSVEFYYDESGVWPALKLAYGF